MKKNLFNHFVDFLREKLGSLFKYTYLRSHFSINFL